MHERRSRPAQQCQHGGDGRRQAVVEPVLAVHEADRRAGDREHDEGQHQVALGRAVAAVPPQQQRHRLTEHQAQAVRHQMPQRHVGRAIQRERQRHGAAQIGGAEQCDQSGVGQHRRRGDERHGAERVHPAQDHETFEHNEDPGIARLQRTAETRERPGDQGVTRHGSLAVERAGEQGEIGQDGSDQQVLALAEIAGGHHQQHGADRGEHRQPVLEQFAAAAQQRGGPPGAGQHGGNEERDGGELRVDAQHAGEPDRDGGDPHDQRRVDLHHVHVEFTAGHPSARHVEQPGDVVLQRRAQHGEQDDAEYGQQQQNTCCGDRSADEGRCLTDRPGLGVAHTRSVTCASRCPVGGAGSMSCNSLYGIYMVVGSIRAIG